MTQNNQQPPISAGTQVCAIIGNPVSHSLSPAIHNAGFAALGLDFVYVGFRVENLKNAILGMRSLHNFRGLSVTIPHKIEVMNYVDEISEVDRSIGSINTVINDGEKLTGLGTDGPGALKAINDAGVNLDGKSVLMLGAGGAARAIGFTLACKSKLEKLTLTDVDKSFLDKLSADLRDGSPARIEAELLSPESLKKLAPEADLIINCTPVGMHPKEDASLIDPDLFRQGQAVFDIVYNPLETKLIRTAREKGLAVIRGVEMFINQAILQFEQFTGKAAPEEVMRKIVMERLTS